MASAKDDTEQRTAQRTQSKGRDRGHRAKDETELRTRQRTQSKG